MGKVLFLILIITFQGTLESYIPILGYLDELILLAFFIIFCIKYALGKIELKLYKIEKYIFVFCLLFWILGIISNINSSIVDSKKDYIISGILSIKNLLIYFLARNLFRDIKINKKKLDFFSKILNLILTIYATLILIDIPLNFLKSEGLRFEFIKSVSVGFGHAAELDFLAISIVVIQLFIFRVLNKNLKKYIPILLKGFFIVLAAGRTKGMVFYIGFIVVLILIRLVKKVNIIKLTPFIPIFLIIASDRLKSELFNVDSVRGALYKTSWNIAKDFWPLGSGFGTFGSELSRQKYSPLYFKYGLYNKYGLSPDWPAYITDSQWASIIGEVGFLGFFMYIIICMLMTYFLINIYKEDRYIKLAISALWIYGIVSSISDTILITYRGVAISIITAFFISVITNKNNDLNNNINN